MTPFKNSSSMIIDKIKMSMSAPSNSGNNSLSSTFDINTESYTKMKIGSYSGHPKSTPALKYIPYIAGTAQTAVNITVGTYMDISEYDSIQIVFNQTVHNASDSIVFTLTLNDVEFS